MINRVAAIGLLAMACALSTLGCAVATAPPPPALNLGSTMRSKLNFTASALNGVPSWNFTSRRSLNVTLRPSLAVVHDSASQGTSLPSGPL